MDRLKPTYSYLMDQQSLFKLYSLYPEAQKVSQLLAVSCRGTAAQAVLYQRYRGTPMQRLCAPARIGRCGLGKQKEGDGKTPTGLFALGPAFGTLPDPGARLPYTQLTTAHYWVDDPQHEAYNRFTTLEQGETPSWRSAEHLCDYPDAYAYAVVIGYNPQCTPGLGSALFLHCGTGKATQGCVAMPQAAVRRLVQLLRPGARIVLFDPQTLTQTRRTVFV